MYGLADSLAAAAPGSGRPCWLLGVNTVPCARPVSSDAEIRTLLGEACRGVQLGVAGARPPLQRVELGIRSGGIGRAFLGGSGGYSKSSERARDSS